jgi:DUF1680 family protein
MIKRQAGALFFVSVFGLCSVFAQDRLYHNEFPLGDVKLLDGPFKTAMELNTTVLLKYTVDRLLSSYLTEAGLTPKASDYTTGGAWEGLNGHVGGHYLSALSMQYAATGNAQCKERLDYMVSELKRCQEANGNDADFVGYISGVPNGKNYFREVKKGNSPSGYWVPWYNIHKTYAGLRDAWMYGQSEDAKVMFLKLCDWAIKICSGLSETQMQNMLGTEHGGINEMYADAYQMSNTTASYIDFAKKFSHKTILDAMAKSSDNLDGKHANTQVPKVVGFQRIAEEVNDDNYYKAAEFFWTTVTKNRSIVIGGNSNNEYFLAASKWSEYLNSNTGVESCNTNNMLKLTEGLFRMKPEAKYSDFYETALYNHILSTQNPTHGGFVYFTPACPRHYRVYSAPDRDMWCCVGTGMENHTKYGEFIYTHQSDSLFVNLFIASELDWKDQGVKIKQATSFPDEEKTVLTISATAPTKFKMLIRHPSWCKAGAMKVTIGTETFGLNTQPSSYVEIDRTWSEGEVVTVELPMTFTIDSLKNVNSWVAIKRGPIVLGAKISTNALSTYVSGDGRWDHIASGTVLDYNAAPKLKIDRSNFQTQFQPVAGKNFTYKAPGIFQNSADNNLEFVPFFRIHDSRYMMYWNATVTGQEVAIKQSSQKQTMDYHEISQVNGTLKTSFNNVDLSRHVIICSMSGRKIADIPAISQSFSFNFQDKENHISNGAYMVQIKTSNQNVSKKVFVSDK